MLRKNQLNQNFLDMSKAEMVSYSVVLVDNLYSNLKITTNQTIQVKNPFEPIANALFLKSRLGSNVVEDINKSTQLHKEFICDDLRIDYDFFPPKLQIKHITQSGKSNFIAIAKDLIAFAGLENSIGKIGINYEMFLEEEISLKDYLLKDEIAKGFTSLSATPVFDIDENTKLNLTIASAINNGGKKGIYFQANFDNKVAEKNTISDIFGKNFREIADNKIKLILG